MTINEIQTPAILADLEALEHNLKKYCAEAKKNRKEIWPMIKTHKSTELAVMQAKYGCTGFLCGTLDEAEAMAEKGFQKIMYAYPVATEVSIQRVLALSKKTDFIVRLDCMESAVAINELAEKAGVHVSYTIIVNSGLNRFGVQPEKVLSFAESLRPFGNLVFRGISTHAGHVYGAKCKADIPAYVEDERRAIAMAADSLRAAGYKLEIVSSGTTPTFLGAVCDENINIYHPGNYIFNDAIQLSTETATEAECALKILASVISRPRDGLFICDAGAKCLGLDQGAHGNDSIKGFGVVVGHPELEVFSLSEEVGKIKVTGKTNLKVGDKILIIPNHACSSANLTDYYIGMRGNQVERLIEVDIRGNSSTKLPV